METIKVRRASINALHVLKDHGCKTRLLYLAKLPARVEGERKKFPSFKQPKRIHVNQKNPRENIANHGMD